MNQRLIVTIAALLAAVAAQGQLLPGKWWRRPEIVQTLSLSEEQQGKLDAIFRASANDLIDRKAEVEKLNIALRGELDQPQLNRQSIQKMAARLNDARGRLFERELMMLVDMRAVLTDAQWNRMRSELERMHAGGRERMRPPMERPMERPMEQRPPAMPPRP